MTKLELTISASSRRVVACDGTTGSILHCKPGTHLSEILSDNSEKAKLEAALAKLSAESRFETLDLVFLAPGVKKYDSATDRSKLDGVFRSPMEAIHLSGDLEISAFVQLRHAENGDVHLTALEYSRIHRQRLLRREFGSWLLEEHIEQAVIATTMMGEIVFWNRFASGLYGFKAEGVMGKSIVEVTPSEMTQGQAVEIMGKLARGEHWKGQFRVKKRTGEAFVAHVTDTPIMGGDGQCKFIVGVSSDHTQLYDLMEELKSLNANLEKEVQKRTAQLLEHSKALRMVGAAVKASDTGTIVTDQHRKIVWMNDAVCNLLSSAESELKGLFPEDLPFLQQNERWKEFVEASKGSIANPTGEIDVKGLLPVGCINVTSQALSLDDVDHHLITIRDVTSQKEAEQSHFAAEKAIAMSKAKTDMMQMVSHELRSPLQGIMGMTSTMLADMSPEATNTQMFDEISTILASSRVLLTLINTILDIRKIDENMMGRIRVSPVKLFSSIKTAMSFCAPFASQQGVSLVYEHTDADNDLMVMGNRMRLEQTIINLVTNSVKYGSSGNTVSMSARIVSLQDAEKEAREAASSDLEMLPSVQEMPSETKDPEQEVVVVSVRDFGKGIPAREYGKVFGMFSQLSISEEKDGDQHDENSALFAQSSGSGLGLNLVMKFIVSMGGHVWFNNCTDGPGVKFSFSLPSHTDPLARSRSSSSRLHSLAGLSNQMSPPGPISNIAKNLRVLAVDDTKINLKVLSKMLSRLGCKQVWTATGAAEALEHLRTNVKCPDMLPTLIISDLNMPVMNGHQLIKAIKAMDLSTKPYSFAWSADWEQGLIDQCVSSGFDQVLRKPLDIRDLEIALTEKLEEPEPGPDITLVPDDSLFNGSNGVGSSRSSSEMDGTEESIGNATKKLKTLS